MDSSQPVKRTLKVLEFCAKRGSRPASLKEMAEACDIAPATLARMVKTLEAAGYVEQAGKRGYVANVLVKRILPMPGSYLFLLGQVVQELADESTQSAEAIVRDDHELVWHSRKEHAHISLLVKAHPGYRRDLYELDAPSRLILAAMGMDLVRERFETANFYSGDSKNEPIAESELVRIVEQTDPEGIEYDTYGNVNGVRRFCKLIFDAKGNPLHLLCIAEGARMNLNMQVHAAENVLLLEKHSKRLTQAIAAQAEAGKDDDAAAFENSPDGAAERHV